MYDGRACRATTTSRRSTADDHPSSTCTAIRVTTTRSWRRCRSPERTAPSRSRMRRHAGGRQRASPRPDRSPTSRSLSGFVKTRDGEMLVFSILVERLHHSIGDDHYDGRSRGRDAGQLHAENRARPGTTKGRRPATPLQWPRASRIAAVVVLLAGLAGAGGWYYLKERRAHTVVVAGTPPPKNAWVDQLYSANPTEAEPAHARSRATWRPCGAGHPSESSGSERARPGRSRPRSRRARSSG